ncbi:MAG: class I SAM-dependent methyltransferase [Elusimicrobiota bacterium]|jgi:SAM-dependent methyltransferase|nr:class I SAM-dependent methyltransferase [Elusimicrobiota bacterium]
MKEQIKECRLLGYPIWKSVKTDFYSRRYFFKQKIYESIKVDRILDAVFKKIDLVNGGRGERNAENSKVKTDFQQEVLDAKPAISETSKTNKEIRSSECFYKFIALCNPSMKILDIGCGAEQPHSQKMREQNLQPKTCDYYDNCDFFGNFNDIEFEESFDAIWASHVLEHQPNVNLSLNKIRSILKEDGILAITVPPLKHQIISGHVSLWNGGLLLYHLILAGFDCRNASLKQYGYNISVILKKKTIDIREKLNYGVNDLEIIREFLPPAINFKNSPYHSGREFDGDISAINWD